MATQTNRDFEGRAIIVTGAAGSIGHATACVLAEREGQTSCWSTSTGRVSRRAVQP